MTKPDPLESRAIIVMHALSNLALQKSEDLALVALCADAIEVIGQLAARAYMEVTP